ncbi:MAG: N(4)-(beta-N-acetylglucosaminyl)-L-asparaginase [Planctomycetota bacterium]
MSNYDRRDFLRAAGGLAAAGFLASSASAASQPRRDRPPVGESNGDAHRGPAAVSSGNGFRTVTKAREMIMAGADPAVAAVTGVAIVEEDPSDMTVGYGGLPNERGVVQLDSSVMHGPLHKAGAVACIEDIKNPAQVALKVLQTTDHVMLVGEGAKEFAIAHGFKEENLLTERARQRWLRWKMNSNPNDDWLDEDQRDWTREGDKTIAEEWGQDFFDGIPGSGIPFTYGTIHCSAVTPSGDLAGCTTTSGLSYKIPGRVGDSPIIGAGNYTDNEVGSAGCTGRGESVIQSCGAFSVVREMENGATPTEACLNVLKKVSDRSIKQKRLRDASGKPNFGLTIYAMRKDGAYGSATMHEGATFTAADSSGSHRLKSAFLYSRG